MSNTEYALEIEGLSKQFTTADNRCVKALDDVSLKVPRGAICGLLGPNGAGKTTMLRIVNNILSSDSGSVAIMGVPLSMKETSPMVGYMPEERGLYDNMRVEDQILLFGRLKGGDDARLREAMGEYLELFNLADGRRRKIKELSKGNQQKVQIIATLVHEPQLVMLDEPFSGFDPINGELLRQLIDRLNRRGTTVMLSSHNMEAIENMCSRIALVNHGHLLLDGDLSEIKESHRDGSLIVTTHTPLHIPLLKDAVPLAGLEEIETPQHRRAAAYRLRLEDGIPNADLLAAVAQQSDIVHFEEHLPSLHEIFLQYAAD